MSERTHQTVQIAAIEERGWSPLRLHLGVRAFGINAFTSGEAGATVIPEHDEVPSRHEEVYVVTAGRATFTVEAEEIDAPAGTVIHVPDPAVRRGAVAREAGTIVLAVGGPPDEVFEPMGWELNSQVLPLFESGDHEGVKRLLTEALDGYARREHLYYNLACAEAQLGETDAALEHLAAAVQERPSFAVDARDDPDFVPLHGLPRFTEIVGEG